MGNSKFTNEEIRYLVSLPAVVRVANGRIEYSDRFKRHAMARYKRGDSPVRIFRDAGLDPALIGYKRIERCVARWKTTPKYAVAEPDSDSAADSTDPANNAGSFAAAYADAVNGGNSGNSGNGGVGGDAASGMFGVASGGASGGASDGVLDDVFARQLSAGGDAAWDQFAPPRPAPGIRRSQGRGGYGVSDVRDVLIMQQIRRIADLEEQVDLLKARLEKEMSRASDGVGVTAGVAGGATGIGGVAGMTGMANMTGASAGATDAAADAAVPDTTVPGEASDGVSNAASADVSGAMSDMDMSGFPDGLSIADFMAMPSAK